MAGRPRIANSPSPAASAPTWFRPKRRRKKPAPVPPGRVFLAQLPPKWAAVCALEYRFDSKRRWRLDAAFLDLRVGMEFQGGIYVAGRHTRGAAMEDEYEKLAAAAAGGWVVLQASTRQLNDGRAVAWALAVLATRSRDGQARLLDGPA